MHDVRFELGSTAMAVVDLGVTLSSNLHVGCINLLACPLVVLAACFVGTNQHTAVLLLFIWECVCSFWHTHGVDSQFLGISFWLMLY